MLLTLEDTPRKFCAFVDMTLVNHQSSPRLVPFSKQRSNGDPTVQNTSHGSGRSKVGWTTGGWHTFVTRSTIYVSCERERERERERTTWIYSWHIMFLGKWWIYYCKGIVGRFSQDRVLQNGWFPHTSDECVFFWKCVLGTWACSAEALYIYIYIKNRV